MLLFLSFPSLFGKENHLFVTKKVYLGALGIAQPIAVANGNHLHVTPWHALGCLTGSAGTGLHTESSVRLGFNFKTDLGAGHMFQGFLT